MNWGNALWQGDPASLGQVIAELLNTPGRLQQWGVQARERLKPTYLQRVCLDSLERMLRAQAARF